MTEHRIFRNVEVRDAGTGPNGRPMVELQAITPDVVDDYGSLWNPAAFDAAVTARMAADPDDTPSLCWAHNWSDPIGHGITYTPSGSGPSLSFELDDFDAVPRAKQADAQVRSKTIRDCSVGFSRTERRSPTDEERVKYPGVLEVIESADLDEVSLVLRGAVPGAKVLSLRTAEGTVDGDLVLTLAKQVAAGELTQEEAQAALRLSASLTEAPEPAPESLEEPPGEDHAEVLAEAEAALQDVLRSR